MRALPHKHRVCVVLFPRFLKVFARLCFVLLFSQLCFACFASQTSDLCSAFPSVPESFMHACMCFVLLFSKLCYACFASQTSGLCSAIPSVPGHFLHACVYFAVNLLCVLCLANIGFVQCFSLASCNFLASLFCFIQEILLCVLCLSNNCLCSISKFPRLRFSVRTLIFSPCII